MFDVQVNEHGQITIPKTLREKGNINPLATRSEKRA